MNADLERKISKLVLNCTAWSFPYIRSAGSFGPSFLTVGRVALVGLVEELFRELKLSEMLTRVTVAVEEPEQSRLRSSVSDSAWSHARGGEILVGDLWTNFLKEPISIVDPA